MGDAPDVGLARVIAGDESTLSDSAGRSERVSSGRFRLGLRARTTAVFALGALTLSVLLSALTYQFARHAFYSQRRDAAVQNAVSHSRIAKNGLAVLGAAPGDVIDQIPRLPGAAFEILKDGNEWPSEPTGVFVPSELRAIVKAGSPGRMSFRSADGPALAVGLPLAGNGDAFFEVSSMRDLRRSLSGLARALFVAATATTLGAALVGRAASGRVVRPLRQAAVAAGEISSGRLDTRLPLTGDGDFDPLVTAFNDMAASLERRLEREARFASDVSHELRTPLTALSTAAQLLKGRRDEFGERSQTALDVLVIQTERFERLVLDLLEISRFDAGAAELNRNSQDIVELVAQVVALSPTPGVEVDASALRHRLLGVDQRRIERVLTNLLQNAQLYAGGATRVGLEDRDDAAGREGTVILRVIVDDAGPGVTEEEKAKIFERFRRGSSHSQRPSSAPKGTGLGLSLVVEHARLHGGSSWVEDAPGGGARFVVEFEADVA